MPSTPLRRLLGYRVTQASSGTAVISQPISPWFEIHDGFVDLTATTEVAIFITAMTGAPPAHHARTVNMSLRYLRPCTVEAETVIVRGRILHAGSSFTTVEALLEDALGRAVAHATGSVVLVPMDPAPPPLSHLLEAVDEPAYPSPDPPQRPLETDDVGRGLPDGQFDDAGAPPIFRLLGAEIVDRSKGRVVVSLPTSGWFCVLYGEVAAGIVGTLIGLAGGPAVLTCAEANERMAIINQTTSFLTPIEPDGRALTAVATVQGQLSGVVVTTVEVTDPEGRTAMIGQGTALLRDQARGHQRLTERRLLSVLFTDVVGSTERAGELGDARWRELLDEHHAVARRQLELHKGREVKTTGDGFLATFESPTRAVQCARAIAEGLARLGLEIRAGVHTGECEVGGGDIAGLAVHIASRIQSAALTGEILVSNTTRELVAGSGLEFVDRGEHDLKGVPGSWHLFALQV